MQVHAAPDKKHQKKEAEGMSTSDLAEMFKNMMAEQTTTMMNMMSEIKKDNKIAIEETRKMANEAKGLALGTKDEVGKLKATMDQQAKDIEELKKQDIERKTEWPKLIAKHAKAFAKASAAASTSAAALKSLTRDAKKKARTIAFETWAAGTESKTIKKTIEEFMEMDKDDLDGDGGSFALGEPYAVRGAARFKMEDLIWKFMRDPSQMKKFDVDGNTYYINRDIHQPAEDITRERAVRKLLRAIIETEGGNATTQAATRKSISAKYELGLVFYKGKKVGSYLEGKMSLTEEGQELQGKFDTLMAK